MIFLDHRYHKPKSAAQPKSAARNSFVDKCTLTVRCNTHLPHFVPATINLVLNEYYRPKRANIVLVLHQHKLDLGPIAALLLVSI